MKESRPKAEAGGDALAIADQNANLLQRVAMTDVAFHVGEERAVVALSDPPEMCRQTFHQRAGLFDRLAVLLVSKQRHPVALEERRFRRQLSRPLICAGEPARLVLAGLDVRLIERIDGEKRTRN